MIYKNILFLKLNYSVTGFMSVMHKDPVFRNDPKLCNIKYPE